MGKYRVCWPSEKAFNKKSINYLSYDVSVRERVKRLQIGTKATVLLRTYYMEARHLTRDAPNGSQSSEKIKRRKEPTYSPWRTG